MADAVDFAALLAGVWTVADARREVSPADILGTDAGTVLCPWHAEGRPSCVVFEDGVACMACGRHGDVLDLVMALEGCDLRGALEYIRRLAEGRSGARRASAEASRVALDWPALRAGLDVVPDRWLAAEFGVRVGRLGTCWYMPHATRERHVVGVKVRDLATGEKWAVPGSRFPGLYGAWRWQEGDRGLLVCEGESDTWTAAAALEDLGWDVAGLPRGVGSPVGLCGWAGRGPVVLALDGDPAGRAATERWVAALGEGVRALDLPDGQDLRGLGAAWLRGRIGPLD